MSLNVRESMDDAADVLRLARRKGVRLWCEDGQLRYRAHRGALSEQELERLRGCKGQILALLRKSDDGAIPETHEESRRRRDRAPLSFSQLAHWHLYRLGERRTLRQVAFAFRLRGLLDLQAFRKAVDEVVSRHDALRTRIVKVDGELVQEVSDAAAGRLVIDDLTSIPERAREQCALKLIEQHIIEPVDISVGPLFSARLVVLGEREHQLVIAMEHMISDAASMGICLRDVFSLYTQAVLGTPSALPGDPLQFTDHAARQQQAHKAWVEQHGTYWAERLKGCGRLQFPSDANAIAKPTGWAMVPLRIGGAMKRQLSEWRRLRRTTLVMSVFTAYVALVLRWCNVSEGVIQYQGDGRNDPRTENSIGYFASILYLRLALQEDDTFIDLMNRITMEYCNAHDHADFSYLEAQQPRPEFARNGCFNWVPHSTRMDLEDLSGSPYALTCVPVSFSNPVLRNLERDNEPSILLFDSEGEIVGGVYFPLSRFTVENMERFGRDFLVFLNALLRDPDQLVKEVEMV